MTVQEFVEKAVKGGWQTHPVVDAWRKKKGHDLNLHKWALDSMLLDPEAWKAVAKVEGWDEPYEGGGFKINGNTTFYMHGCTWPGWMTAMHRMIDALAEGKTIEEFIETL